MTAMETAAKTTSVPAVAASWAPTTITATTETVP